VIRSFPNNQNLSKSHGVCKGKISLFLAAALNNPRYEIFFRGVPECQRDDNISGAYLVYKIQLGLEKNRRSTSHLSPRPRVFQLAMVPSYPSKPEILAANSTTLIYMRMDCWQQRIGKVKDGSGNGLVQGITTHEGAWEHDDHD